MIRITKDHEERRTEIIERSQELFEQHGYNNTSVATIINTIGIAKGTFYYYFASKEELLVAIVQKQVDVLVEKAKQIEQDKTLSALEKFTMIFSRSNREENEGVKKILHQPQNREIHEKTNVEIILHLSPIVAKIVKQGIQEGVFQVEYPLETIQALLTTTQFFFEDELFGWSRKEREKRGQVVREIIEKSLGAKAGTFHFLVF